MTFQDSLRQVKMERQGHFIYVGDWKFSTKTERAFHMYTGESFKAPLVELLIEKKLVEVPAYGKY